MYSLPSTSKILEPSPLAMKTGSRPIARIAPTKDVDGFSVLSAGELLAGLPGFRPCTPYGCMKLIESTGVELRGKHAVVVGRSNTVGKRPVAPFATGLCCYLHDLCVRQRDGVGK